jgi:hypothetical protein
VPPDWRPSDRQLTIVADFLLEAARRELLWKGQQAGSGRPPEEVS